MEREPLSLFLKLFRTFRIAAVFAFSVIEVLIKRPRTRAERAAWLSGLCGRLLRSVNATCSASGPIPTSGAVITNHLSYVDILVHGAIRPCVFVSKAEVRKMPLFGWVSFMAGTVYVERGAGGSARRAAEGMAKGFRDGLPVTFFPEGTTGVDDKTLMPFRSGLLAQALTSEVLVWPGYISYELPAADVALGRTPGNDISWGPQTLPAHLWNLLGLSGLHGHIRFGAEAVPFTPAGRVDRKIAAVEAREAVLRLIPDAGERT